MALGEGRKQTYGSQIGFDESTNKYYVLPLEDPDRVDQRRASVGLRPAGRLRQTLGHHLGCGGVQKAIAGDRGLAEEGRAVNYGLLRSH